MLKIEKYLLNGNRQERENCCFWLTSFGIQSVVGLKPSEDLDSIITRHIEGKTDIHSIRQEVHDFYHEYHHRTGDHNMHRNEEADKVSVRTVECLLADDFELSLKNFSQTHHHLFHGIYHHSGELREKPFSKKEWVLGDTTILYPKPDNLEERLLYLFDTERCMDYSKLSSSYRLGRYSHFIANLMMLNAFHHCNSRAVFVYALKYLLSRGYHLQNDTFYREAWYFRNAIIRACYTNMHQGVYPTTKYMEMFLSNLLLDKDYELKNHRMMIRGE
jgi:fido (protein-threonine AMPylation protein)